MVSRRRCAARKQSITAITWICAAALGSCQPCCPSYAPQHLMEKKLQRIRGAILPAERSKHEAGTAPAGRRDEPPRGGGPCGFIPTAFETQSLLTSTANLAFALG